MCGITGWVDWDRDLTRERGTLQSMTSTMACRGPDAEGLWTSPHAAIGHRRLAVIDLEGGVQPMVAERGRQTSVVLTYSGELYNFADLRRELESLGHRFRTRSDTEVVLQSYLRWEEEAMNRFNGMFAFGIWDSARDELLLGRDRLGIKPLYYAPLANGVLFGSEPKAIIANPLFSAEVDEAGLAELFALPAAPTPGHGMFRGMRQVKPGHAVSVRRGRIKQRRYWQMVSRPHTHTEAETAAHLRELLTDTVRRQLVADVPSCVLLSGGIDSSALAALASRCLSEEGRPLSTFALDFAGSQENFVPDAWRPTLDGPYVKLVAETLRAGHTDVVLDPEELLRHTEAALRARDLPSVLSFDIPLYLLCRDVKRRCTVALSGESGDELFGGYPWHSDSEALAAQTFPWQAGQPAPGIVLNQWLRAQLRLEEYAADRYAEAIAEVPRLDGEPEPERRRREALYLGLTRFLPIMLDRKDRMSMAVGLEVRVPYCDHRLVEYVWNIPWEIKTAGGLEKGILRRAVADLLPGEVTNRRKSGFPIARGQGYGQALRDRMRAVLDDTTSGLCDLLDASLLTVMLDVSVEPPQEDLLLALFSYLIAIDSWLREYRVIIR